MHVAYQRAYVGDIFAVVCLQELSGVLASVRVEPPTQQALDKARAGLLNSFVFNFASSYSQLQRTLVYQLLGLPQVRLRFLDNRQCTAFWQYVWWLAVMGAGGSFQAASKPQGVLHFQRHMTCKSVCAKSSLPCCRFHWHCYFGRS